MAGSWVLLFLLTFSYSPKYQCVHILLKRKKRNLIFKETPRGTSLVVQGLRFHAPNAGGLGSIPGQGTRACMPQLRASIKKKKETPRKGRFKKIKQTSRMVHCISPFFFLPPSVFKSGAKALSSDMTCEVPPFASGISP